MSPKFSYSKCLSACALFAVAAPVFGQSYLVPQGDEFSMVQAQPGDQIRPALALSSSEAWVVWQDNAIDKSGAGIGATKLDNDKFTKLAVFKVNKIATFDQIKPKLAILQKGRVGFTWECQGSIYSRVLRNNSLISGDVRLNTNTKDQKSSPVITGLSDGSGVVAWESYGQDGDMWGIFARKISSSGIAVGTSEFLVNQATSYNQRHPAIATLANGSFVIAWVSERQNLSKYVDVYARIFNPAGKAVTDEFRCSSGTNNCEEPVIAALPNGGFTLVWSEKSSTNATNSLDVVGRSFTASGSAASDSFTVNTFLYGDQYSPKIAAGSSGCMVVWTSLGQDGSREGVFGRFLKDGATPVGDEIMVNQTTASQQIYPDVAWNGIDRFLVTWSTPTMDWGFDLYGRVYNLNEAP